MRGVCFFFFYINLSFFFIIRDIDLLLWESSVGRGRRSRWIIRVLQEEYDELTQRLALFIKLKNSFSTHWTIVVSFHVVGCQFSKRRWPESVEKRQKAEDHRDEQEIG